ncbi:MAG: helix-turn-helix transcriptional regulator [Crocosphaera sp.]
MKNKFKSHRYSDLESLERLMVLIATLVKYPGVGYCDRNLLETKETHHNALEEVKLYVKELADKLGMNWSDDYPATATLRKDLETLKEYEILERRMYRWGYYIGTGVMSPLEFKVALDALKSLAVKQGDPRIRQIYNQLKQRIRGFNTLEDEELFYPVRQQINHSIDYTDPQEMMEKGEYRRTLFHHLEQLEIAITKGQAIEISRKKDLYKENRIGSILIWPLQLIYHNIAWYLLYECCSNEHLAIGRMNRFGNYCKIIDSSGRGIFAQKQSLTKAHKLLENGWGLKLGDVEEQQQELAGKLELINTKVRFFTPISQFIEEGERRHPKQKIRRGTLDPTTNKPEYIDYSLKLPPRSIDEFSIWVKHYGEYAQVLSPETLVEQHKRSALALAARYGCDKDNIT